MLADWFARKNVDGAIIFIQYLFMFLYRFVQLLTRLFHPNLKVYFTSVLSWPTRLYKHRVIIYKGWSYNNPFFYWGAFLGVRSNLCARFTKCVIFHSFKIVINNWKCFMRMLKAPTLLPRTYISQSSKIDPTQGR